MQLLPFLKLKNDAQISYLFNNLNDDVPVVFVNGSIFNFKQWYPAYLPAFKKLTNNQRSFLFYDYQGIGLSSFKTDKFSMIQLVDELKQLLDHLHLDRVHLFGVSKGTMVSQSFAGSYPDRVASIGGYGVINLLSSEEDMASTKQEFIDLLDSLQQFRSKFNQRMDKQTYSDFFKTVFVPTIFFKPYSKLNFKEKFIYWYVSRKVFPMLDQTPIGSYDLLFRYYVYDLINERPYNEKVIPQLSKIPAILWLNGTIDQTAPLSLVKRLVEEFPNSSLIEFENYDHIGPNLDKKKAFNIMESYVTFLNKQSK